ncbi:MAG TPA: lmo0937 family membrane protein [Myxococcaceae bacterium]|nr:lmo0937 family membrane protein [Myxococcaceae bacterium]
MSRFRREPVGGSGPMLWTMAIILLVLWMLGMVSGASLGWWIHLFFLFALVALILATAQRAKVAV